ncbi:MAG TPA: lysophospholipid acyltransferase family protein [Cyclobacteriaceae bacterium]|jgi:1-acyl-sn-glycerol-3-phosphate acyltransferase|nr:lysophospholipid acyltransferase family protein [Cyclobacteriaceae bacterium]
MNFIRKLHTAYGFVVFTILFTILFPFFLIPIFFRSQFHLTGVLNRWWARILFPIVFLPYEIECRSKLKRGKQYIFCPNHTSYLDIAVMGFNPIDTIFVGKTEVEKVPIFGFMYRKLHITVDRKNLKSRSNSLKRSLEAIDEGKSLVIFPEGGILSKHPPQMTHFKVGAFRTAIEKQIPIVPVTIPYNWIILPDKPMLLHRRKIKVIFHEPIETIGLHLSDCDSLKDKVYKIIEAELKKHEN